MLNNDLTSIVMQTVIFSFSKDSMSLKSLYADGTETIKPDPIAPFILIKK